MTDQIKCEKCGGEMERILLAMHGNVWCENTGLARLDVGILKYFMRNIKSVNSYRCTSCGYLESYAK